MFLGYYHCGFLGFFWCVVVDFLFLISFCFIFIYFALFFLNFIAFLFIFLVKLSESSHSLYINNANLPILLFVSLYLHHFHST